MPRPQTPTTPTPTRLLLVALAVFGAGVLSLVTTAGPPAARLQAGGSPPPGSAPSTEPQRATDDLPAAEPSAAQVETPPLAATSEASAPSATTSSTAAPPATAATPSSSSSSAPATAAVAAPAHRPPGPGRVFAVLVGIDDYPGVVDDLLSARDDVQDLEVALASLGVPSSQVLTLYDGAATAAAIVDALRWLVANAGPSDTAVFMYAGHVIETGPGEEVILAADRRQVADWQVAGELAGLASRDAWLVFATCFGAGFDEAVAPGRILTAAAGEDSLSYESDAYGRSYLGEFVVRRGLLHGEGGGPTVQQAVAFGAAQLAVLHPNRQIVNIDMVDHPVALDGVPRDGGPIGPTVGDESQHAGLVTIDRARYPSPFSFLVG
ncbi:MAG: caspase family protein [Acidimicrobiales bacterium]